jgi:hypothetical protein
VSEPVAGEQIEDEVLLAGKVAWTGIIFFIVGDRDLGDHARR